jgi:hypothetical protein
MAASREDISRWFDQGSRQKATHLIVVCDTFDHEDYPVFVQGAQECLDRYNELDGRNMQRVMEVYDLRQPKAPQMDERRAMRLPNEGD